MFEIISDTTVERLSLMFPTEKARMDYIDEAKTYGKIMPGVVQITFDMKHLEKFKKRYPDYEIELIHRKNGPFKGEVERFAVWAMIVDRETGTDSYIYRKLDEVEEEISENK